MFLYVFIIWNPIANPEVCEIKLRFNPIPSCQLIKNNIIQLFDSLQKFTPAFEYYIKKSILAYT